MRRESKEKAGENLRVKEGKDLNSFCWKVREKSKERKESYAVLREI